MYNILIYHNFNKTDSVNMENGTNMQTVASNSEFVFNGASSRARDDKIQTGIDNDSEDEGKENDNKARKQQANKQN